MRRQRPGQRRAPARRAQLVGSALVLLGLCGAVLMAAEGAAGDAAPAGEGARVAGERLYQQQCVQCHGTAGEGTQLGPALTAAGAASADFYLRSGRMPIGDPDEDIERGEPHFDDAEIRELVEYVAGLGEGPAIPDVELGDADLSRGGDLYRLHCASCHNWDGKGGALAGGRNAPDLHGVPPAQVAEAVRVGPGSMPGFSEDVLGDDDLDDVVAYVRYLDDPEDAGGFGLAHWGPVTETVAAFFVLGGLLLLTGWLGTRQRP